MCKLRYGRGATRADVEDLAICLGTRERQQIRLIDIAHMDEVAALPPILVDDRSVACRYLEGKVLSHAGVGIRNRLARANDIEIAKHRNGNPIRTADGQEQLFLGALRDGVDTLRRKGLPFIVR